MYKWSESKGACVLKVSKSNTCHYTGRALLVFGWCEIVGWSTDHSNKPSLILNPEHQPDETKDHERNHSLDIWLPDNVLGLESTWSLTSSDLIERNNSSHCNCPHDDNNYGKNEVKHWHKDNPLGSSIKVSRCIKYSDGNLQLISEAVQNHVEDQPESQYYSCEGHSFVVVVAVLDKESWGSKGKNAYLNNENGNNWKAGCKSAHGVDVQNWPHKCKCKAYEDSLSCHFQIVEQSTCSTFFESWLEFAPRFPEWCW